MCLEPISGSKIPQAVNIDSLVLQPESFRYFRITSLLRGNSANDNRPFYCHQGFSNLQMPVPSDLNAPPSLPAPPVHVLTCASRKWQEERLEMQKRMDKARQELSQPISVRDDIVWAVTRHGILYRWDVLFLAVISPRPPEIQQKKTENIQQLGFAGGHPPNY